MTSKKIALLLNLALFMFSFYFILDAIKRGDVSYITGLSTVLGVNAGLSILLYKGDK